MLCFSANLSCRPLQVEDTKNVEKAVPKRGNDIWKCWRLFFCWLGWLSAIPLSFAGMSFSFNVISTSSLQHQTNMTIGMGEGIRWYIIGGVMAAGILILDILLWVVCERRKKQSNSVVCRILSLCRGMFLVILKFDTIINQHSENLDLCSASVIEMTAGQV